MAPRKHDLWLTKCKNRILRGPIDPERSADVRDQAFGYADSRAGRICGRSVAQHRVAWCAVQWRVWLGEAGRTGRGLVAGRPCVDPLKRGDQCREYCDDYRNSEKYDGGAVAIRLVIHEGASSPE
jgi:hypothetical protein